jgi:hypothetical protein
MIGRVPSSLQEKISRLLQPHLVERSSDGLDQLLGHDIVDFGRKVHGETILGCLSCS